MRLTPKRIETIRRQLLEYRQAKNFINGTTKEFSLFTDEDQREDLLLEDAQEVVKNLPNIIKNWLQKNYFPNENWKEHLKKTGLTTQEQEEIMKIIN